MNKKSLFSVIFVGVLILALSVTVFAVSYDGYEPLDLDKDYSGYLTVFDAKADLQLEQGGTKYYKVENMEARITTENNAPIRKRFIIAGAVVVTLGSSNNTGVAPYNSDEDYLDSLSVGDVDTLSGPYLKYTDTMQDETADGIFNARYGFENSFDKLTSDGKNMFFSHKLGFEYIKAEPGVKIPVTVKDFERATGRSSFTFEDKDGIIEDRPDFTAVEYQTGYIYIPLTVSYNLSGATGATAPADQTQYAGDTFTLAAIPAGAKVEDAAFAGWTTDSAAATHGVYKENETLPAVVFNEYTIADNYGGGDIPLYAVWAADEDGSGDPDVYETTVTYEIKNGTWDGTATKISETLKKLNDKGEPAADGEAELGNTIPDVDSDEIVPADTYTKNGVWDVEPTATTKIGADTTYTYMLTKTVFVDNTFGPFEPKEDYRPTTLANGDVVYSVDDVKYIVDTVTGPDADGIYTVTCDKDENGDDTLDKYQIFVTYKVVGGTWKGTSPASDTVLIVLDKINNGAPAEDGYARLNQNGNKVYGINDAEADDRHDVDGATWKDGNAPDPTAEYGGKTVKELTFTLELKETAKYDVFDITDSANPVPVDVDEDGIPDNPQKGGIIEDVNGDTYVIAEVGDTQDPNTGNFPIYVYPDDDGNGIPNFAQKDVTLRFVNGDWNGETEKTYQIELKDAQGEWDANGTGTIVPFPVDSELNPESDKFVLGKWNNNDLPTVSGNNAETFTYTFAAKEIKIVDPITKDPLGDIIKILRWSGKTPSDGTGEKGTFKATAELRFAIGTDALTKTETDAILATATFAAYDPVSGEFPATGGATTDQFTMKADNNGKVTITALKSGLTKVMLNYAGTPFEFVVVTPGDANLDGNFNNVDWQLIRAVFEETLDQDVSYEAEVNSNSYDFFPILCDMKSMEFDAAAIEIDGSDWTHCKGLVLGF